MKKCLYCYQGLDEETNDFHIKCSRTFFGSDKPPVLSLAKADLKAIAKQIIAKSVTVTGVQPKLSLEIEKVDTKHSRLTIVGKKNKLKKSDFINLAKTFQLNEKSVEKILSHLFKKKEELLQTVETSFLSNEQKTTYIELIKNRLEVLR